MSRELTPEARAALGIGTSLPDDLVVQRETTAAPAGPGNIFVTTPFSVGPVIDADLVAIARILEILNAIPTDSARRHIIEYVRLRVCG